MEKAGFPSLLYRVLDFLCSAVCPWLELGGISEASLHLSSQQDAVKLAQGETEAGKAVIHGWTKGVRISSRGHQGPQPLPSASEMLPQLSQEAVPKTPRGVWSGE